MSKRYRLQIRTPEAPVKTNEVIPACQVLRLGRQGAKGSGEESDIIDLLQAMKMESESLLGMMELHQKRYPDGTVEDNSSWK